jgi:hypothetical protein
MKITMTLVFGALAWLALLVFALPAHAQAVDPFGTQTACKTCPPGKDGKNGLNGKDGRDGIDGLNGRDGKDGRDGRESPGRNLASPLVHVDGRTPFLFVSVLPGLANNLRNWLMYNPATGELALFHQFTNGLWQETRPASEGRVYHGERPRTVWTRAAVVSYRDDNIRPQWILLQNEAGDFCLIEWRNYPMVQVF